MFLSRDPLSHGGKMMARLLRKRKTNGAYGISNVRLEFFVIKEFFVTKFINFERNESLYNYLNNTLYNFKQKMKRRPLC